MRIVRERTGIVAHQLATLPLYRSEETFAAFDISPETPHPPPKTRLKNRPTARNGFFEDFAEAGAGVVCAAAPPAELFASPADASFAAAGSAKLSAPPFELSAAATWVCTVPAGACGTAAAGASPALTAAGKGCCSAAVFSDALPPGAAGFNRASATDIVCSGGHPHDELSWSTTSFRLPCSNSTCCPGLSSYVASPNWSATFSTGAFAPRFSTHVSPFLVTRSCRSSGPSARIVNRRSGVITTSRVVTAVCTSIAPRSSASISGTGTAPSALLPAVTCNPLVAHTRTVPPLFRATSATRSLAVTVVFPIRIARPLLTSSAPATVASCTPTVPIGCCVCAGNDPAKRKKINESRQIVINS
jgi:hypothetical protein